MEIPVVFAGLVLQADSPCACQFKPVLCRPILSIKACCVKKWYENNYYLPVLGIKLEALFAHDFKLLCFWFKGGWQIRSG